MGDDPSQDALGDEPPQGQTGDESPQDPAESKDQASDSSEEPPVHKKPSLVSPLMSGRSLEPERRISRWEIVREHRALSVTIVVVLLVVLVLVVGKVAAERAADSATQRRADHIGRLLDGVSPREFLAFNAGVKNPGSIASKVRDQDGFVSIKAAADMSFIRFQPSGWWSGFTERCIVAVVTEQRVDITVPKVACIRVTPPGS